MDDSEEELELLEFLRNSDLEGCAELIGAMEASPIASKLVRECRWCDYDAVGSAINEILLDWVNTFVSGIRNTGSSAPAISDSPIG